MTTTRGSASGAAEALERGCLPVIGGGSDVLPEVGVSADVKAIESHVWAA